MLIKKNGVIRPSYHQDFARSGGESKNPGLWKGAIGLWAPFLGPTGNRLLDWSPFRNHLSINGIAAPWGSSSFGTVLNAPGVPGYLSRASTPSLEPVKEITILALVRFTTTWNGGALAKFIVANTQPGTGTFGYTFGFWLDGTLRFYNNPLQPWVESTQSSWTGGEWYLIAATYDHKNMRLFVNDVPDGVTADTDDMSYNATEFRIGQYAGSHFFGPGQIACVFMFDRALPDEERKRYSQDIRTLFQTRKQVPIVFLSGAIVESNGTHILPIMSKGGEQINWSAFDNTITTPDDSSTTVEIRTTDDADGGSWSAYGAIESAANSIFGQIKLSLSANTGATQTPAVSEIKAQALLISGILPHRTSEIKVIKIDASDSPYTMPLTPDREILLLCDTDSGAITVNLQVQVDILGQVVNIKNIGSSENDVTVNPGSGEKWDKETSQTVSDDESLKGKTTGTVGEEWVTL